MLRFSLQLGRRLRGVASAKVELPCLVCDRPWSTTRRLPARWVELPAVVRQTLPCETSRKLAATRFAEAHGAAACLRCEASRQPRPANRQCLELHVPLHRSTLPRPRYQARSSRRARRRRYRRLGLPPYPPCLTCNLVTVASLTVAQHRHDVLRTRPELLPPRWQRHAVAAAGRLHWPRQPRRRWTATMWVLRRRTTLTRCCAVTTGRTLTRSPTSMTRRSLAVSSMQTMRTPSSSCRRMSLGFPRGSGGTLFGSAWLLRGDVLPRPRKKRVFANLWQPSGWETTVAPRSPLRRLLTLRQTLWTSGRYVAVAFSVRRRRTRPTRPTHPAANDGSRLPPGRFCYAWQKTCSASWSRRTWTCWPPRLTMRRVLAWLTRLSTRTPTRGSCPLASTLCWCRRIGRQLLGFATGGCRPCRAEARSAPSSQWSTKRCRRA
mmetsp:Transcript_10834/g.34404  ORF Transcript_10834/g.34404 Transcript_10834/m.34404 type:complete len:434 (+) Transcript_10834:4070-5371(+)